MLKTSTDLPVTEMLGQLLASLSATPNTDKFDQLLKDVRAARKPETPEEALQATRDKHAEEWRAFGQFERDDDESDEVAA